jgi:hypothetical protein
MTLHPLSPVAEVPFGDMPLAPFAMTKRTEADLAQAMAEHVREAAPSSGSEALSALRRAFPQSCSISAFWRSAHCADSHSPR